MNDLFFELVIKDESFRKIGTWKFQKKDAGKFLKIINDQFGLGLKVIDNKKEDRDLDWLK
jgi:hypothetical protein